MQSLEKTLPDEGRKVRKTLKMQERQKEGTAVRTELRRQILTHTVSRRNNPADGSAST